MDAAVLRGELCRKLDNLNKPRGSLGRLEDIALQVGMVQGTPSPALSRPCHLLLAADHGVEREGVSASPREVTWQQMLNFARGGGAVNVLCRQHGIELTLVDVGVDHDLGREPSILARKVMPRGTRDFLRESAMGRAEAERCLDVGAELADRCVDGGCNVLSVGEMGVGNTSASSLWMHLLLGVPLAECVGAGSGLGAPGVARKLEVLRGAVRRARPSAPMDVMAEFGGLEMAVAVGVMLRARQRGGVVVLVDGFIMTACALMAERLAPGFADCAIFCHQGGEAGHAAMLDGLGARGLLSLGLRLGEGTGALCAYPLVESAVRLLNEMNSFGDAGVTKYF